MGKKELDQLETLRAELEVLRHEYERYFMGLEKRRPTKEHTRIARVIRRFSPGKDAIMRFRHQSLQQRLLSFERYWNRVLKAIEDGRYERDVFKANFRENRLPDKAKASAPTASTSAKAKAVGDEAAAFLAGLTGSPAVGMRGSSKRAPAKAPPKPAATSTPKKPPPPIGLRGKPVGRPKSEVPSPAAPPVIQMRGRSKKKDE